MEPNVTPIIHEITRLDRPIDGIEDVAAHSRDQLMTTLDAVLVIVKRTEEELLALSETIRRNDQAIKTHTLDIRHIKNRLSLS